MSTRKNLGDSLPFVRPVPDLNAELCSKRVFPSTEPTTKQLSKKRSPFHRVGVSPLNFDESPHNSSKPCFCGTHKDDQRRRNEELLSRRSCVGHSQRVEILKRGGERKDFRDVELSSKTKSSIAPVLNMKFSGSLRKVSRSVGSVSNLAEASSSQFTCARVKASSTAIRVDSGIANPRRSGSVRSARVRPSSR